ncbi:alkaline phosphatase [Planosporangium flavigriseum]|uniref:alkaline phosphatase D family protein n=1 Tax=Planosporangium flavigriseum TaxID=373681 RepID=UPI00143986E5|nr:alkaline phosphatase D family protein [Planosporangium flavigriseum]NJC66507.1 alkaline phosphatase [Planosporangium flavigriseum]
MTSGLWSRRRVLGTGAAATLGAAAGSALLSGRAAAFVPAGRPVLTHGVQSGDAVGNSAYVWTRADRVGRMFVEVSERPDFRHARVLRGPLLTPDTDFTGKLRLTGLRPGQKTFYRVQVEADARLRSEPLIGSLAAPGRNDGIRFVWTGDIAGQGYGINPEIGGMRIFRAMRDVKPDFYLCSGDNIYADGVIPETIALPDGRIWRNITTPAKRKVAETLDEYRGNYAYNLLDANLRAFAAEVPQINQWDDHEVRNNWYPGQILDDPRYTEKRVDVLAARAKQAYREWVPVPDGPIYRKLSFGPLLDLFVLDMRTYKDPNDGNVYADPKRGLLGREQREWLIRGLTQSRASWKVIANDLPLGLVVGDGPGAYEGVAQGDNGAPKGRELEFAEILRTVHRRGVENIVFVTADVHYSAAHHYDPARAAVGDFTPFWEFVSGPANAGAFGPGALDGTFGPRAEFVSAPPRQNASPAEGFQHFGEVDIDRHSRELTVRLRDLDGAVLWAKTLPAAR